VTPTAAQLEWVRPPQQERSQKTLGRILDAAEAMIEETGFDKATVAAIARRAGSSVGAFYARFADKEALLNVVIERFHEQAAATIEHTLAPERWQGVALEDLLENTALFLVQVFRQRRRMIGAFSTRVAGDPQLQPVARALGEQIADKLYALLVHRCERITHPNPSEAVGFAMWLVLGALEARALHGSDDEFFSDQVIATEATRIFLAYLGAGNNN
jgi:AcrR family transcriptional regulator